MPKLERLDWVTPLSEGRGVTLSDDPAADQFLAEDPNALLLGVLYDSQYQTRRAFSIPLKLRERLGHFDLQRMAAEGEEPLLHAFLTRPALHRFPGKFARQTLQVVQVLVNEYGGDAARVWTEASDVEDLGRRLMALPCFGTEKTNWTVGMLGTLGLISLPGWEEYRATVPKGRKSGGSSP
jgi:uncharacterized HhH-GPD family protein